MGKYPAPLCDFGISPYGIEYTLIYQSLVPKVCVQIMVRADIVKSQPLLQDMITDVPHPLSEI